MSSLPPSGPASIEKHDSIKELVHEKPFPMAESCPIQIAMDRFPAIAVTRKKLPKKCKSARLQSGADGALSEFKVQGMGDAYDHFFQMKAEENWGDLTQFVLYKEYGSQRHRSAGPSPCRAEFELQGEHPLDPTLTEEDEELEQSHALARWEFWMKDKRRTQEYLSRRLEKSACRLLLQESDKYRKKLEEKGLSTYTQIPEPDKWRGHPFRWKAELRLPNRKIKWNSLKSETLPQYCAVKTSLDTGEIPAMEFIGIPQTIRKEKGLICEETPKENAVGTLRRDETDYFRKRRKKLKPHDIDMEELEVIGKKILPKIEETSEAGSVSLKEVPDIVIEEIKEFISPGGRRSDDTSIFCLVIGEKEIKYELRRDGCQVPANSFTWQVHFGVNTVGTLVEKVLRVENRGTLTVRYNWFYDDKEDDLNLEKLQPRKYEPWFFFNKNSGLFLPGQVYHMKFYHQSEVSGVRKEVWVLKTEPPLTRPGFPCTVTFSAIATEEICHGINPLEKYLNSRVGVSTVKCIIEILLMRSYKLYYDLRGIEYRSIFSSKTLFEYNNPERYYNSTIVDELSNLYKEIKRDNQGEWDMSLDTLVRLVKTYKKGKEKNSILTQINEQAKLLLKPVYITMGENKKYKMTYKILCNMANFMEDDYEFFRCIVSREVEKSTKRNFTDYQDPRRSLSFYDYDSGMDGTIIRPLGFMFFKTLFYIKVYYRLCEAVEHIAGVLETAKLFEPWIKIDSKPKKPIRKSEERLYKINFRELWMNQLS